MRNVLECLAITICHNEFLFSSIQSWNRNSWFSNVVLDSKVVSRFCGNYAFLQLIMTIVNRTLFSYLFCIFYFGSLWWSNPALCFCCNSFIFSFCENYAFLQLIITIVNRTFINYFVCMFFLGALWWSNLVLCFLFFPIFTTCCGAVVANDDRVLF